MKTIIRWACSREPVLVLAFVIGTVAVVYDVWNIL